MQDNSQHLEQLIPFENLQSALKRFCASVGIGCIIVDPMGKVIIEEDWQCFCKRNHSMLSHLALHSCVETKYFFSEQLSHGEKSFVFTCNNGFSSICAPIIVEGTHIANIFIGLFFLSPPESKRQKQIAAAKGFKEVDFLAAVAKIPVFSTERLKRKISQIELFVELINEMGRNVLLERQANRQRLKSEERYRDMINSLPLSIYETDSQGKVIFANPTAFESFDYSPQEITGEFDLSFLFPPNEREEMAVRLQRLLAGEELEPKEYIFKRKDGSCFSAIAYSQPIYANGKTIGIRGILFDITHRKQAEEKLQQSEAKLRSLFRAAPIGLAIVNENRTFRAGNEKFLDIIGYETADLLDQTIHHLYEDEEEYNRVGAALYGELREQRTSYVETQLRHRDGSLRTVSLCAAPIEPGSLRAGVAVAIQDITEQKRTLQALQDSEERYKTLFEGASDAILIIKDGLITDCNQKTLEIFRSSKREILGRSPDTINLVQQPEDRTLTEKKERYLAAALQGRPQQFEWLHTRSDGTVFHADISLSDIELSGEKYLQAIIRDITERKNAEKALKENEFRFRSFFNTNPEGIILVDFQGTLLDANKAFLRESGYSLKECVHKHFNNFVPEEDRARIVEAIVSLKSGFKQIDPLKFSYIAKDGTSVPVAAKGWLIVDDQSVPLYLGVFIHNLTNEILLLKEKATLEKQVFQAQKNDAIGTLAGGIAHDFNNILAGIIGYTELALYRDPAAVDTRIREYLERVLEGSNRAKNLVQQILRFSRNSNTVMEPIHLTPVIEESLRLLRSTLPSTVEIRHHLSSTHDKILGDPTQIHQVIMNLATNAYHAMRDTGGLLTVSLENVILPEPRQFMSMSITPGEYLKLRVADTGAGIAPVVLERIFEPYFSTKKGHEGTGLGMAVVMGIVKGHNGLIEVETVLDKGSRFDIYLPFTQSIHAEMDAVANNLSFGHGEQVLIVDDEAYFLEVVTESLKLLGYQVTASQSSVKTLETYRANPRKYDLLITDQTMPEMTGVQLTREVRRINSTMPIVLCTGYSEMVTEQSACYYGITSFLMKPVNIYDLSKAVDEALSKERDL